MKIITSAPTSGLSEIPRGKLIVIEGPDGAGKSTLQQALFNMLFLHIGAGVVPSREPTYGPHGMAVREAAKVQRLEPERELELLLKDRYEHVRDVIEPALSQGAWVVLDRYYFSNVAYQGAVGLSPQRVMELNESFAPVPDLLLILDLPMEACLGRIEKRGKADAFEDPQTLIKVIEIFRSFEILPYAHTLDASDTQEELFNSAWALIKPLVKVCSVDFNINSSMKRSSDNKGGAESWSPFRSSQPQHNTTDKSKD